MRGALPRVEINKALLDAADLILFSSEPYRFLPEDLESFARDYDCPLETAADRWEMTSWYGSRAIQVALYGGNWLARFLYLFADQAFLDRIELSPVRPSHTLSAMYWCDCYAATSTYSTWLWGMGGGFPSSLMPSR